MLAGYGIGRLGYSSSLGMAGCERRVFGYVRRPRAARGPAPGAPAGADLLNALLGTAQGKEAETVGEVRKEPACMVMMHTGFGDTCIIDLLLGDLPPRIR